MSNSKLWRQIKRGHYLNAYDNVERFVSYFYQVDIARKLNPKRILEIGVGNKTVTNYLKRHGYDITSCDFDWALEPDCVADIRDLPFQKNSYDVVLAFEILEHLPWSEVEKALSELYRVTRRYVAISVPYSSATLEFLIQSSLIKKLFKKSFLSVLFLRVPYFFLDIKRGGEHYWEIGRRNYPISRVRKVLKTRFKIIKEIRPIVHSAHHFFILQKADKV